MAKDQGKVDWNSIKSEYITTKISYIGLAKKYGFVRSQIERRGAKENWPKLRRAYAEKCVAKSVERSARKEINRLSKLMDATNRAADVALKAFQDEKQFNRYIVTDTVPGGGTETNEREFQKIDSRALRDLTVALKDLTGLMRDFYNIPTPAQAEAQRIAAERLELDRAKASSDGQTDSKLELIGIPEAYKG